MTKETSSPTLSRSLSQADFETVARHCYKAARKIVAAGHEVAPVLLLGTLRNGSLNIGHTGFVPLETLSDKQSLVQLMQDIVQQPALDFVVHITESWLLKTDTLPDVSIANHPRREEVVIFNIMSKDCQIVVINPLLRNPSRLQRGKLDFSVSLKGLLVRPIPTRN